MTNKADVFFASIATAISGAALASLLAAPDRAPMYQAEAVQAGYEADYRYGARDCEGADDPAELILAVTVTELADAGCTDIFEL